MRTGIKLSYLGIALLAIQFASSCRLTETGPHATILPNGSDAVPVNSVIEIHFDKQEGQKQLGLNKNSVNGAISIRECAKGNFDYFLQTPQAATDNKKNEETNSDRYGPEIKFLQSTHLNDKKDSFFVYLIPLPTAAGQPPLQHDKTYCVKVNEVSDNGFKFTEHEISFRTQSENFAFADLTEAPTFLGTSVSNVIDPNDEKQDHILIRFPELAIESGTLSDNVTLCEKTKDATGYFSQDCEGLEGGRPVASLLHLVQGVGDVGKIKASYSVYAIRPIKGWNTESTYQVSFKTDSGVISNSDEITVDSSRANNLSWLEEMSSVEEVGSAPYKLFEVKAGVYSPTPPEPEKKKKDTKEDDEDNNDGDDDEDEEDDDSSTENGENLENILQVQ